MADACIYLMSLPDEEFNSVLRPESSPLINIGIGEDLTIRELADAVGEIVEYEGEIVFDPTKPDGTPRKLLDVSRLQALGWRSEITLEQGLRLAYKDFLNQGGRK